MARTIGSNGVETSEKLLAAALTLIANKGYAAVSMREIAEKVGIQVGGLYNYFPNKQSVLAELLISHMNRLLKHYETHVHQSMDAKTDLENFVHFHIRYHINKPNEVFIAYMELRNLEEDNFKAVQSLRQQYERKLRTILRDGANSGVFQISDVSVVAMAILSMLTGVNTWFRYGGRLTVDEIERIYLSMIMKCVGVTEERNYSLPTKEIV